MITELNGVPVKVSAGTVPGLPEKVGTLAGQAIAGALFVPAGVKETVPFVPVGVPALTALVVAELPENICAAAVKVAIVGVIVLDPPMVPTSPLAANVPNGMDPFSELFSAKPAGQLPEVIIKTEPDGIDETEIGPVQPSGPQGQRFPVELSMYKLPAVQPPTGAPDPLETAVLVSCAAIGMGCRMSETHRANAAKKKVILFSMATHFQHVVVNPIGSAADIREVT